MSGRRCAQRRLFRRLASITAALCCCLTVLSGAACAPSGAAVGDTRTAANNTTHDSVDIADITVGVLYAGDSALDERLLQSCNAAGLKAVYAAGARRESPAESASNGMDGFVSRRVSVVVMAGFAYPVGNDGAIWRKALGHARSAGIPVVLVEPSGKLPDRRFYASVVHIGDGSAAHVQTWAYALESVINDNPHSAVMNVELGKGKQ